jgi:hypothetical protein
MTVADIADWAGIQEATWRAYVARARAPRADGHDEQGRPWWWESTVRRWDATRPGQGVGGGRPRR